MVGGAAMTRPFEDWGIASVGIAMAVTRSTSIPLPQFSSERQKRPRYIGLKRMSKQSKQLANAERVADEAICTLSRLSDMFAIHLDAIEATYPESFTNERDLLVKIDDEVKRLRAELEGTP